MYGQKALTSVSGCTHACICVAKPTTPFDQNGKQCDKFKGEVALFSYGEALCPTPNLANWNNIDIPQKTGVLDQE